MRIIITVYLVISTFVTISFSQNSPVLENIQSEITQLINIAKYSVVTVSSKSSHAYIVEKAEGLFSFLKNNREEKRDNLWTVGSGIIYNDAGYIITRSSILADFEEIKVTFCDGTTFDAQYIGTHEKTGLTLLKIDEKKLEHPRIGNSAEVALYSLVFVMGNSMGISPFASYGLINGYTPDGMFILSAPINPGNIGGAVFNLKGEIIGILAAQLDSDVSSGAKYLDYSGQTGVALPINQICQMIDEIIKLNQENKGWLGVGFNPDSLKKNKLILSTVIPGSPAELAGLREGDQLLKFNESDLLNTQIVSRLVEQTKPGTSVSINFIRRNRPLKVFPTIGKKFPPGFNSYKPRSWTGELLNERNQTSIQSPIILSPEKFQEINLRMIQMENEIQILKSQLKK